MELYFYFKNTDIFMDYFKRYYSGKVLLPPDELQIDIIWHCEEMMSITYHWLLLSSVKSFRFGFFFFLKTVKSSGYILDCSTFHFSFHYLSLPVNYGGRHKWLNQDIHYLLLLLCFLLRMPLLISYKKCFQAAGLSTAGFYRWCHKMVVKKSL